MVIQFKHFLNVESVPCINKLPVMMGLDYDVGAYLLRHIKRPCKIYMAF
jgi:hypothetical protein